MQISNAARPYVPTSCSRKLADDWGTDPVDSFKPSTETRADLAKKILADPSIVLHTDLPSGNPPEGSDPNSNIVDTAAGKKATRSHYGTAPGGSVYLDKRMLAGMLALHQSKGWNIEISAICGGEHSKGSLHYSGLGFDILKINGVDVDQNDGTHAKVMADLRKLGATQVLGPGHAGHDHHVHAAWPRRSWSV